MSRTAAERLAIERDGPTCRRCGRHLEGVSASAHHRKLRRHPDADQVANIVVLCGSGTTGCHGWVHANPAAAREDGWMLRGDQDPLEVPVWPSVPGLARVYLLADGTIREEYL